MRGSIQWDSNGKYAVSVGMRFNRENHRNQNLDVDNYIKPTLDAVAAGLFCDEATDPWENEFWKYDDSNFRTLLIHRLPDTPDPESEGVAIYVSVL